jgi:hypothetical protein
MHLSRWKLSLLIAAPLLAVLPTLSAQQITYYDFNTPQANPSQVSYSCAAAGVPAPTAALFCFNDETGASANPSFIYDTYPPSIDPTGGQGSSQYAIQTTPATGYQGQSLWFSVPQKVVNGFTTWFAFKIDPNGETADGIALVLQNAAGGGNDTDTGCAEQGSGVSAVGAVGGCLGYGGLDNSVALEFDTYQNNWDSNANHIALQSCGAGVANSPDHSTCNVSVTLNNTSVSTLVLNPTTSTANPTAVTLADGNVHQVVVIYNGPNDTPSNYLYVYLDPPFVSGTHTPDPTQGATPIIQGGYDLTTSITPFINSGSTNDSAYVGFTSATGYYFEQDELMAWTFTTHSSVSQLQPLNPPGTPTIFYFGSYDFSVTYPVGGPSTSGISMAVTANAISPADFSSLMGIGPSQFTGTQCQVYDDTGGNCIIFSAACVYTATNVSVACPNTLNTNLFIDIAESYDNSIQPTSPGLLQGDPLYSAISSITGDGTTATVTCGTPLVPGGPPFGECAVTPGQTVTIFGAQPAGFNGTFTVQSSVAPNTFTFLGGASGSSTTGGFVTSNNVQNIFTSYTPETIDGTSAGHTKSFSEFAATALTVVGSQTQVTAATNTPIEGSPDLLTATVTAASNAVPGPGSMPTGTTPAIPPSAVTFFSDAGITTIPGCVNVPVTSTSATTGTATCSYTPTTTGSVLITAQYSDVYHVPSSGMLTLNVAPPFDASIVVTLSSTMPTYGSSVTENVCITPATSAAATGTVALYDGTTLLKTLTLGSNGCAKWTITPPLSVGTHTLTAFYSGDKNNPSGTSAPSTVTVSAAVTKLSASCGPSSVLYGETYQCAVVVSDNGGYAKGAVTFTLDGGTPVNVTLSSCGLAVYVTKASLGAHSLVIYYAAQGNYGAAGPVTEKFTVVVAPVSVNLSASSKSIKSGKPETLTASVCSPVGNPTSGSVSFYDGSTLLTTVAVNSKGVASYTTSTLSVGSHTIKAVYGGSTGYGTGSATVSVTVTK